MFSYFGKIQKSPWSAFGSALPHLNDTMLLFTGLWLMKITHFSPFNAPWLGTKILLLLAYIALGMMMMRARPRSTKFYTVYLLAMCCVACIVYLAKTKVLPF